MRIRSPSLNLRLPRHPWLRALLIALGALLLAGLLTVGLAVGVALLVSGALVALLRRWLGRPRETATARVIEGEFEVIDSRPPLPRARNG